MSPKVEKLKKKVPELRFPGFEGEWEEKRLGEVYSFQATNSLSRDKLNYVSGQIKNIHYGDIHTKFRSHFNITKERVPFVNSGKEPKYSKSDFIECGDLVLADASEDYADIGKGIEVCQIDEQKILSGLHTLLLKAKPDHVALGFMGHLIKSPNFRLSIKRVAQGTKVLGISKQYIQKLKFQLPQKEEQQKIASFLSATDEWIENLKAQKGKWEEYKKGMMQKIFSQETRFKIKNKNGELVELPEWEEKKMGEVADIDPSTSSLPSEFYYIDLESVDRGQLNDFTRLSKDNAPSRAQRVLERDDILFQTVRPYQQNNLFFNLDGDFVASTGYAQMRAKQNPRFLYQYIHTQTFLRDVLARCTGSNYPAINSSDLKKITIRFPSEDEQQKIASFLTAVDEMIHSHQQKITQAEEWKNGLMQRMFV